MKYLLKQAFVPLIYLVFADVLGLCVMVIAEKYAVAGVIVYTANLVFYAIMMYATSFKDGEKALDVRETNDRYRAVIAKTGENLPLNLKEEYKAWKGFAYGFLATVPAIVLIIIHTIVVASGGLNTVGLVAGLLYMPIYSYFLTFGAGTHLTYYFVLLSVPAISLMTGIPYVLGAKRAESKYIAIRESQKALHGDD